MRPPEKSVAQEKKMKREFLQGLMEMPKEVMDAIMAENGRDIHQLRQSAQDWEQKYNAARLEGAVGQAIAKARGRNQKAITALLDLQALQQEEDLWAAAQQAVEKVKADCGYLFETVPPYAAGTGSVQVRGEEEPQTLASALKEKFAR
jgi:hypothetical protein